jgi:hypothetical protein
MKRNLALFSLLALSLVACVQKPTTSNPALPAEVAGTTVTGADGKTYRLVRPASKPDAHGVVDVALWERPDQPGVFYIASLSLPDAPPIFRRAN